MEAEAKASKAHKSLLAEQIKRWKVSHSPHELSSLKMQKRKTERHDMTDKEWRKLSPEVCNLICRLL